MFLPIGAFNCTKFNKKGFCRSINMMIISLLLTNVVTIKSVHAAPCTGVPGTWYNVNSIQDRFNWISRDGPRCIRGDIQACGRVDRALNDIDVALDQMLRHCTGVRCKHNELDTLLYYSYFMAIQDRALMNATGWVRSRKNSYDKHLQWNRVGYCSAPRPPQPPSCTPPTTIRNPAKMYYIPPANPYPDAELCLTDKQSAERRSRGEKIKNIPGNCPPICDPGYQLQYYNGIEVCLRCPAGTSYKNNCCF